MKNCSRCELLLDFSMYFKNKSKPSGLQSICKTCHKNINNLYYASSEKRRLSISVTRKKASRDIKDFVWQDKTTKGCLICKESDGYCLDYHHISDDKEKNISMMRNMSIKAITVEIAKCVVLCSNCHRKHHGGSLIPELESYLKRE